MFILFHSFQETGRIYKIGDRNIEINQKVLSELTECNEGESKEDAGLDNEFTEAVLSSIVAQHDMETGKIDPAAVNFAIGKKEIDKINIF